MAASIPRLRSHWFAAGPARVAGTLAQQATAISTSLEGLPDPRCGFPTEHLLEQDDKANLRLVQISGRCESAEVVRLHGSSD